MNLLTLKRIQSRRLVLRRVVPFVHRPRVFPKVFTLMRVKTVRLTRKILTTYRFKVQSNRIIDQVVHVVQSRKFQIQLQFKTFTHTPLLKVRVKVMAQYMTFTVVVVRFITIHNLMTFKLRKFQLKNLNPLHFQPINHHFRLLSRH